jgi:hypothetical protein
LTSPHDAIISNRWRSPQANFNTRCDGTLKSCPRAQFADPLQRAHGAEIYENRQ